MQLFRLATCVAALAAAAPSWASDYAFEVIYLGNGEAVVAPGSDDPTMVTFEAGDTFIWAISAQPGYRWSVLDGGGVFPLMAFAVDEPGQRKSDHVLTLSYQGSTALLQDWTGDVQSSVHMGTNSVMLPTGLVFDRLLLEYTLLGAFDEGTGMPITSTPTGLLPIFGMVDVAKTGNDSITIYGPVPEPATWALWLGGLLAAGAAARRRCRA